MSEIVNNDVANAEDISKYVDLLDDAMREIMQLIKSDSYHRFMQTDKFKQLNLGQNCKFN